MLRYLSATQCVFLFFLALLAGNGYVWLVNHVPVGDSRYYLLMAEGRFEQVASFHRYRILLPVTAGGLARLLLGVRQLASGVAGGPALGFSFYVLNTVLLAAAGTLIYRTARACGASFGAALFGAGAVLSSGITTYLAGSALVDSLAVCAVAAVFYALTAQDKRLLWWSVVGLLVAKEQLALLLPVALYYGQFMAWQRRLAAVLLAVGLLFLVHYQLDTIYPYSALTHSLVRDAGDLLFGHLRSNVAATLRYVFTTWRGLGDTLVTFGGFNFLLLLGLGGGRAGRRAWLARMPPASGALLACVGAFVVLSGEVPRMLFFAGPCFGVAVALIVQYHPVVGALRRLAASNR